MKKSYLFAIAGVAFLFATAFVAHLQLLQILWIPVTMVLFLIGFPIFAMTGGRSLFRGLFDLDFSPNRRLPLRIFVVTLTALCVAGSASRIARLALMSGPVRMGIDWRAPCWLQDWVAANTKPTAAAQWCVILTVLGLAAYVASFAIWTTTRQSSTKHPRPAWISACGAAVALIVGGFFVWITLNSTPTMVRLVEALKPEHHGRIYEFLRQHGRGYTNGALPEHVSALFAFFLMLSFYSWLGIYGWRRLGKLSMVPALASALWVVLVLGWFGGGLELLLSGWHVPLLLLLGGFGALTSNFQGEDHTYSMVERDAAAGAPAAPTAVLEATGTDRAIVVACAGGGIQAAAWSAQVLEGLHDLHGGKFERALRMISGISGGSMGSVCYVNWLPSVKGMAAELSPTVRKPSEAAKDSSLDEVAWGLAWPDLLRTMVPFFFGRMPDRADAMEKAWCGNATILNRLDSKHRELTAPLSQWNAKTASGDLPALVMNSTMVELGGPLLMGTTDVVSGTGLPLNLWISGDELHQESGGTKKMDVTSVRAARLSATFPYVTPVARPAKADKQPHMIDGGLFDNSGMATASAWLDQALAGSEKIRNVLVIQVTGFPPNQFQMPADTRSGWWKQIAAPLEVLVSGRVAGQTSHGEIEMKLLREKWKEKNVAIEEVTFSYSVDQKKQPPLSWHLTPREREEISLAWDSSCEEARKAVADFLAAET